MCAECSEAQCKREGNEKRGDIREDDDQVRLVEAPGVEKDLCEEVGVGHGGAKRKEEDEVAHVVHGFRTTVTSRWAVLEKSLSTC